MRVLLFFISEKFARTESTLKFNRDNLIEIHIEDFKINSRGKLIIDIHENS